MNFSVSFKLCLDFCMNSSNVIWTFFLTLDFFFAGFLFDTVLPRDFIS